MEEDTSITTAYIKCMQEFYAFKAIMGGMKIKQCIILVVILAAVLEVTILFTKTCDYEERVDISNTTCIQSKYIGRKLFFHICMKENKTVYDLRYFWRDKNTTLKADIIGVQMTAKEYAKICNFCP